MEKKYEQIRPENMFVMSVERTIKHDTPLRMHYEYDFRIEARQTPNDFINMFAALVIKYRRCHLEFFADLMGVPKWGLSTTLLTLTGAGVSQWTEALTVEIAETLLRETTLPVGKIAETTGLNLKRNGLTIFSRWFASRYKCSPLEWRKANSADSANLS